MLKKVLVLFTAVLMFVSVICPVSVTAADGVVLFVSPSGSDTNDGSISAPLATIQAAKEKLRELKGTNAEACTVYLREGTYYIPAELIFDSDDMPGVRFCAFDGEAVTVSGAAPITGFTEEAVNGVKALTKQLDKNTETFSMLCHPEKTITTTRYPESGAFTVNDVDEKDNLFTKENTFWEASLGNTSFNAKSGDIKIDLSNPTDVYVRIIHRWVDEFTRVTAYESDSGKVRFERPASAVIEPGDEYWFENVFEALDKPGEWYLDSAKMKLYYIPFEGETAENTTLYAPQTSRLITIDGCSGISFENISFRNTEWTASVPPESSGVYAQYNIDCLQAGEYCDAAFNIQNADFIFFKNCDFTNIGNSAVKFIKNVHNAGVTDCYFDNIGSGAVVIRGENISASAGNSTEIMSGFQVTNNSITNYGQNTYESVAVHLMYAKDCEISNNSIHNGYYSAISAGWMWSHDYQVTENIRIKDNLIYNIGQGWLGDLGGIYTLGEQKGTVLSGNVIYNVVCGTGKTSYGGIGIYCDAGSSYMTIENNLVYDCSAIGISISDFSNEQLIRNNIIAMCNQSLVNPGYTEGGTYSCEAINNIFISDDAPVFLNVTNTGFKESSNILWDMKNGEAVFFSDGYNSDKANAVKIKIDKAAKNGFTVNDKIADPMLKDIAKRDFTPGENSPALSSGFKAWNIFAAGTLKDTAIGTSHCGGDNIISRVTDLSAYTKTCSDYTWFDSYGEPLVVSVCTLISLVLLIFALYGLEKKRSGKYLVCAAAALLIEAVALYTVFTSFWIEWLYGVVSFLFLAGFGVVSSFAYLAKKKASAKRSGYFVTWLIGTVAVAVVFYGLIYYLNNIAMLDSAESILPCYAVIAFFIVVTFVIIIKNKGLTIQLKENE